MICSRLAAVTVGLLLSAVLLLQPSTAVADAFVSFNGQFHFTYPETWMQIDYTTAEYYLTRGKPDQEVDFEAVFSVKDTRVLFQGQYLILTVDTIGSLTPEQVDSVVGVTADEFKRPIKRVSSDTFLTTSCRDSILYDSSGGWLGVETEFPGEENGTRINLLLMKFYPRGIANFYFYVPAAEFAGALAEYRNMVMSFSTENLDKALGRELVRVADSADGANTTGKYLVIFAGLLVIALAIVVVRFRRAKKQG